IDGHLSKREKILMLSTRATHELLDIGVSAPEPTSTDGLGVGEVGYLIRSDGRAPEQAREVPDALHPGHPRAARHRGERAGAHLDRRPGGRRGRVPDPI